MTHEGEKKLTGVCFPLFSRVFGFHLFSPLLVGLDESVFNLDPRGMFGDPLF